MDLTIVIKHFLYEYLSMEMLLLLPSNLEARNEDQVSFIMVETADV